jgi:hypothetical protein
MMAATGIMNAINHIFMNLLEYFMEYTGFSIRKIQELETSLFSALNVK